MIIYPTWTLLIPLLVYPTRCCSILYVQEVLTHSFYSLPLGHTVHHGVNVLDIIYSMFLQRAYCKDVCFYGRYRSCSRKFSDIQRSPFMVRILDGCSFPYMLAYGVNQKFRFDEGIWLYRKSGQILFFLIPVITS